MKTTALFAALAYISSSAAAPTVTPASLSTQCINLTFDAHNKSTAPYPDRLSGDCLTVLDDPTSPRLTNGISLNDKIWNRNAVLEWNACVVLDPASSCKILTQASTGFLDTCVDCVLVDPAVTLRCECRPPAGRRRTAWIRLGTNAEFMICLRIC
jgi:hypothetical protein